MKKERRKRMDKERKKLMIETLVPAAIGVAFVVGLMIWVKLGLPPFSDWIC